MRIVLAVLALVAGFAVGRVLGAAEDVKRRCDKAAIGCDMCSHIRNGLPPAEAKACDANCDLARSAECRRLQGAKESL